MWLPGNIIQLITYTSFKKSKNLTPQPTSLQGKGELEKLLSFSLAGKGELEKLLPGKGELEKLLPSPFRGGVGGGVKLIIATGASYHIQY